jgi:hypothetical protein
MRAVLVDNLSLREGEHRIRAACVEGGDAGLKGARSNEIVMCCPSEQFASRLMDDEVVVEGGAEILCVSDVPNPGIGPAEFTADVFSPVGRRIVCDKQLEIQVRLGE